MGFNKTGHFLALLSNSASLSAYFPSHFIPPYIIEYHGTYTDLGFRIFYFALAEPHHISARCPRKFPHLSVPFLLAAVVLSIRRTPRSRQRIVITEKRDALSARPRSSCFSRGVIYVTMNFTGRTLPRSLRDIRRVRGDDDPARQFQLRKHTTSRRGQHTRSTCTSIVARATTSVIGRLARELLIPSLSLSLSVGKT